MQVRRCTRTVYSSNPNSSNPNWSKIHHLVSTRLKPKMFLFLCKCYYNTVYGCSLLHYYKTGTSVGRWFGVHENPQQRGWQRAGTLPRNATARAWYNAVPQNDATSPGSSAQERTPIDLSNENRQQEVQYGRRRAGNTLRRVANTLSRVVKRKEPSREEVMDSLPKFWPVMTILIVTIEVALLIAVTVTQGLAPISLTPTIEDANIIGFDNQTETVTRQVVPNFFIGPSKPGLVHSGAMYTPVWNLIFSQNNSLFTIIFAAVHEGEHTVSD